MSTAVLIALAISSAQSQYPPPPQYPTAVVVAAPPAPARPYAELYARVKAGETVLVRSGSPGDYSIPGHAGVWSCSPGPGGDPVMVLVLPAGGVTLPGGTIGPSGITVTTQAAPVVTQAGYATPPASSAPQSSCPGGVCPAPPSSARPAQSSFPRYRGVR
ncbi:MAG: hypothetical protein ACRC7O_04530 [Fimbriiglobus sp.]